MREILILMMVGLLAVLLVSVVDVAADAITTSEWDQITQDANEGAARVVERHKQETRTVIAASPAGQ